MKSRMISLSSGLSLLAIAGGFMPAWANDDQDHEQAYRLVREGRILSLEQIIAKHHELSGVRLLEVELKRKRGRYLYEIEYLAKDGRVWEWRLDARDGTSITRELEE
ncbi:MAG: hypothetical protein HQL84_00130 [Magnetococcales bacterium]|nr:hypothetical protein [Magnetococcales bacterium]MBF0148435.1 hypothetical protein [Magnetococcales bacterium]MBF0173060.1 hypothetical protein [Magnetococcales bacterium]MBF0346315.1 hypothetical protein [Magnetococcales bacterium]MBF0631709.1 hypothetical protein [Magnetococcales bacterium]